MRIYLAGPSGVGKTTVAGVLAREYGFERVGLGDMCREECQRRGWPEDRRHLQRAGDRLRGNDPAGLVRRVIYQNTVKASLVDGFVPPARVVVDGVRLFAEALALRDAGFIGVAVSGPAGPLTREVRGHPTEVEAGRVPVDLRLEPGDLYGLRARVKVLTQLLEAMEAERAADREVYR